MKTMTIGKTARKAEVGVETIRFYERCGLIDQPPRPIGNGYRDYPEETVHRIRFIRKAQEIGFSLREINELLSLCIDPDADCADVRERARSKIKEVKRKIAGLTAMKTALEALVSACPGKGALGECSILEALAA
ncbi:MAG: MerR family transcriptional regulator [Alphaproteobacteria bacterium]|nr:MAG: MerR family transcriptional regulator [Alphaproteobacteria bacterium]